MNKENTYTSRISYSLHENFFFLCFEFPILGVPMQWFPVQWEPNECFNFQWKPHAMVSCQGTHSNCIFKFPVFSPCPTANFRVYFRDLLLLHTQNCLGRDLSSYKFFWEIFAANFKISFTFRIRELTTWANQIPCVLAKFPNSLCFPWQGFFFATFPFFTLFSLCSGSPSTYCSITFHYLHLLMHSCLLILLLNSQCSPPIEQQTSLQFPVIQPGTSVSPALDYNLRAL